jgi:8-oxo-dGTP diphosphatase
MSTWLGDTTAVAAMAGAAALGAAAASACCMWHGGGGDGETPSRKPAAVGRPKVGCAVLVLSPDHPGCVLLGLRRGSSAGEGTWALPGGHVEHGESFEACAVREAAEETGLALTNVRHAATTTTSRPDVGYHFVVGFVVGEVAAGAEPTTCEPDKCEGWRWVAW